MNKAEELRESFFCIYHGLSKEAIANDELDCDAHLHEGRVFVCRFNKKEISKEKCIDYKPI